MEEENRICIICDKSLDSGTVRIIKVETIPNFRRASKERKDGKHIEFRNHESLTIYANCCKTYTSQAKIAYAIRKLEIPSTSTVSIRFTGTTDFNFRNLCFMCEEDASETFFKKQTRLSASQRQKVYLQGEHQGCGSWIWLKLQEVLLHHK